MKEKENVENKMSLTIVSIDPDTHRLVRCLYSDVLGYAVDFASDGHIDLSVRVCHCCESGKLSDVTTSIRFDSMPYIHVLPYAETC